MHRNAAAPAAGGILLGPGPVRPPGHRGAHRAGLPFCRSHRGKGESLVIRAAQLAPSGAADCAGAGRGRAALLHHRAAGLARSAVQLGRRRQPDPLSASRQRQAVPGQPLLLAGSSGLGRAAAYRPSSVFQGTPAAFLAALWGIVVLRRHSGRRLLITLLLLVGFNVF